VTAWRVTGIHHVQLAMPPGQEERAVAFYAGVVGLRQVAKPPQLAARGGCWFRGEGVELHLGVEEGFRASTKAHPAFRIEGLAQLRAALEASGVVVHDDDTQLEGHVRCYASDPFGNRLELIEVG
jgi:catechol 2,3-dioxygenase-like lactoylglutathione lyase family enzyme